MRCVAAVEIEFSHEAFYFNTQLYTSVTLMLSEMCSVGEAEKSDWNDPRDGN